MAANPELRHWLRLAAIPGIGRETQRRLLKAFGLPEAIFATGFSALSAVLGPALAENLLHHEAGDAVDDALRWASEPGNCILTLADPGYPQSLLDTADPPLLLYAKGSTALLNQPSIAIVGSRNATRQGEANAEAFARALSEAGLTVVSGLALGIDAAAHRGALQGPGSTVAVIGTGPDRIYPARNAALAREIAERGLVLSEFPVGTPALSGNFPRRNAVIAGLTRGCLVVEAAERSGSLITARLAAEAGRDVFAIPGSIHSPLAKGCHKLIKQGAKLVESAQDILEELLWKAAPTPSSSLSSAGSRRAGPSFPGEEASRPPDDGQLGLLAALGHDPCSVDSLTDRTGLTPDTLLAMLLALELDGRVAQLPGGLYQRLDLEPKQ